MPQGAEKTHITNKPYKTCDDIPPHIQLKLWELFYSQATHLNGVNTTKIRTREVQKRMFTSHKPGCCTKQTKHACIIEVSRKRASQLIERW